MLKAALSNRSFKLIFQEQLIPASQVGPLILLVLILLGLLLIRTLILGHNIRHLSNYYNTIQLTHLQIPHNIDPHTHTYRFIIMSMEDLLRQENYLLKNEITQLRNVMDINKDILRLIHLEEYKKDPEHRLLLQIVSKLTAINNEVMIANLRLVNDKTVLKEENLRLNLEVSRLEQTLSKELASQKMSSSPTEASIFMLDQDALKRKLSCFSSQQPASQYELDFANTNSKIACEAHQQSHKQELPLDHPRSMSHNHQLAPIRTEAAHSQNQTAYLTRQQQREIKYLKQYIEQLENRLFLFIKGHKLESESRENVEPFVLREKAESGLLKYAMNDIKVHKRNEKWLKNITNKTSQLQMHLLESKESRSWPKNIAFPSKDSANRS